MIPRISTNLLLRPEDVPASHDDWEVIGTFNPGAVRVGDEIVMLVRVAERPKERRPGWIALPRWSGDEGLTIDWVPEDETLPLDPRVVQRRSTGLIRLTFVSHLRLAYSRDGRTIDRLGEIALMPAEESEEYGVEDPRITPLDGRYYITYVAVSCNGPATALASTHDFKSFTRHGIIFCPENKDVVLFPECIRGQYVALHRPVGGTPFCLPQMWIARSPDLLNWGQHAQLYGGTGDWDSGRVGAGTPPFATPQGWLEIYHGNRRSTRPGEVGAYCGAAMLLDASNPGRVIGVGGSTILRPELEFEKEGFVANVVFPTGIVSEDDRLLVYYGASDKYTAVVELGLEDVMKTIHA